MRKGTNENAAPTSALRDLMQPSGGATWVVYDFTGLGNVESTKVNERKESA